MDRDLDHGTLDLPEEREFLYLRRNGSGSGRIIKSRQFRYVEATTGMWLGWPVNSASLGGEEFQYPWWCSPVKPTVDAVMNRIYMDA